MIYADYAATTPTDPRVTACMQPYLSEQFYNPSSIYPDARKVRAAVERAREQAARLLGAQPEHVFFTSGGTESDNLAILGTALHPSNRKRHIITSAVEHHAVLESCAWLERFGFRVTYLAVDRFGSVSPEALAEVMGPDTFLVSIQWVNNEIGTIQDIPALARAAHEGGAWFHTDAVQAIATQPVSVDAIDLLTFSSHKIYGPKGAGVLYVREGVPLAPLIHGGQQEKSLRGGTENVPALIGMGAAAELLAAERAQHTVQLKRWKKMLLDRLEGLRGVQVNSPAGITADNVLHFSVKNREAEALLLRLLQKGVQASMGSACDTERVEPSHVVWAIGLPEDYARGSIRLSLGMRMNDHEIDELADAVCAVCGKQAGAQIRL